MHYSIRYYCITKWLWKNLIFICNPILQKLWHFDLVLKTSSVVDMHECLLNQLFSYTVYVFNGISIFKTLNQLLYIMSRTFTSNPRSLTQLRHNQEQLSPSSSGIVDPETNIHTLRDFNDFNIGALVDSDSAHRNNPRHPAHPNFRGRGRGRGRPHNRRNSPPSRVPLPRPPYNPNQFARANQSERRLVSDNEQYNAGEESIESGENPQNQQPKPTLITQSMYDPNQPPLAGQSPTTQQHRPQHQPIEDRAA